MQYQDNTQPEHNLEPRTVTMATIQAYISSLLDVVFSAIARLFHKTEYTFRDGAGYDPTILTGK